MSIRMFVVAALLASACAAQAGEKFYKWKDESGAWHYTRTPPPAGAQSENVEVHGAGVSAGAAATPESTPAPTASAAPADPGSAMAGTAPARTDGMTPDRARQRQQDCDQARARTKQLAENTYIMADNDGDGTPELLTDEQHERELERARLAEKLACE